MAITLTTTPYIVHEGVRTSVSCKVGEVKPFGGLEIQLLNGTTKLQGKPLVHAGNSDGATETAERLFSVVFTRYGKLFK